MMSEKTNSRKEAGKHDYSGSWAPDKSHHAAETFSVGIFRWVPKASGNGLKKTAVKMRVRGYSSDPKQVYRLAEIFCDMLDRGEDPGVKSVYASDLKWLGFVKEAG
jgi:hypothetical protein